MSLLAPLFAKLKELKADRLVLVPGETIFVEVGGERRTLGNQQVRASTIAEALKDFLSQDDLAGLPSGRPRILRHDQDGENYVLEVERQTAGIALTLRPARPQGTKTTGANAPFTGAPASSPAPTVSAGRAGARELAAPDKDVPSLELAAPVRESTPATSSRPIVNTPAQVAPASSVPPLQGQAPPASSPALSSVGRMPAASGGARIDEILREMVAKKASDLHLSAGNPPIMRIHGEMHFEHEKAALSSDDISTLIHQVMTEKARADFESLRDADFAYEIKGLSRFRVNVFEDRNGVGAVLRTIPIEIVPADKLGLPQACLDMCWLSKGLVVVTGPTGSGKSTTLAAMIDFINKNRSDHIITIEDPVEFVHKNIKCLVNQREVGQHTKSFKNALRAALREDPDIVLVGEMRDLETISIAIETAETGHLVFGTLHTTTAVSTIDRIIDQFPTDRQAQVRVMLSESLKGVVAQVLLPKIGGGRVAAQEILLGTSAVSALIRDGKTFQLPSVMQTSKNAGMVTMNDALMQLVQKKLVEPKQAYIKATDKNGLLSMFKNAGLPTTFT